MLPSISRNIFLKAMIIFFATLKIFHGSFATACRAVKIKIKIIKILTTTREAHGKQAILLSVRRFPKMFMK